MLESAPGEGAPRGGGPWGPLGGVLFGGPPGGSFLGVVPGHAGVLAESRVRVGVRGSVLLLAGAWSFLSGCMAVTFFGTALAGC